MKVKELLAALAGVDGEMEVELYVDSDRSYTVANASSAYFDEDTDKFIISGEEDEDFCP